VIVTAPHQFALLFLICTPGEGEPSLLLSNMGRGFAAVWIWMDAEVFCILALTIAPTPPSPPSHVGSMRKQITAPPGAKQQPVDTRVVPSGRKPLEDALHTHTSPLCSSPGADEFQWRLSNGLWALFVGFGTVLCALKVEQARSWRFFNRPVRSFLADYGVTLAVV